MQKQAGRTTSYYRSVITAHATGEKWMDGVKELGFKLWCKIWFFSSMCDFNTKEKADEHALHNVLIPVPYWVAVILEDS